MTTTFFRLNSAIEATTRSTILVLAEPSGFMGVGTQTKITSHCLVSSSIVGTSVRPSSRVDELAPRPTAIRVDSGYLNGSWTSTLNECFMPFSRASPTKPYPHTPKTLFSNITISSKTPDIPYARVQSVQPTETSNYFYDKNHTKHQI